MTSGEQQLALYRGLESLVLTARTYVRKDPEHYNPWNYADDLVRDLLEEVLHAHREERG